jgi:6-phosphogluconolactonase (cycloisomerase 2 family)
MKSRLLRTLACLLSSLLVSGLPVAWADTQVYDINQVQLIRGNGLGWTYYSASSPDGNHFYASLWGNSGIAVFDHDQSALTLKKIHYSGSEGVGNMVGPGELGINAAGTILFAGSSDFGGPVNSFSRDPGTGLLSIIDSYTEPDWSPAELALAPSGEFLFVLDHIGSRIYTFDVDNSGSLSNPTVLATQSLFPSGVRELLISPDSSFLYVSSSADDISVLAIAGDGSLSEVQTIDSTVAGFEGLSGGFLGQAVMSPDGDSIRQPFIYLTVHPPRDY